MWEMKKIRLLIVDDHEMVREGLRTILQEDTGVKVLGEADNGEKALELVDKLHPDIVLLDLKMPGMGGIEVCRRICALHPSTAVIALTTFADETLARECIQAGARGYVLKDIERFQLKQIIRTVASGESVIDSKIVSQLACQPQEEPGQPKTSRTLVDLTEQQRTILSLIAQGYSNKEIGNQMVLSENTIKSYIQDLLQKMGARNRVEAAMMASKEGWI